MRADVQFESCIRHLAVLISKTNPTNICHSFFSWRSSVTAYTQIVNVLVPPYNSLPESISKRYDFILFIVMLFYVSSSNLSEYPNILPTLKVIVYMAVWGSVAESVASGFVPWRTSRVRTPAYPLLFISTTYLVLYEFSLLFCFCVQVSLWRRLDLSGEG